MLAGVQTIMWFSCSTLKGAGNNTDKHAHTWIYILSIKSKNGIEMGNGTSTPNISSNAWMRVSAWRLAGVKNDGPVFRVPL